MPKSDGSPTTKEYDEMYERLKALSKTSWCPKRGNLKRAKYEAMKDWVEKKEAMRSKN